MKKACAQHILVKTEKQCLEIKEKIEKGADFGQMAKRFSTCASAKRSGDSGSSIKGIWSSPSTMPSSRVNCSRCWGRCAPSSASI